MEWHPAHRTLSTIYRIKFEVYERQRIKLKRQRSYFFWRAGKKSER